ncbi:MAG: FecR domain-containing protein [Pseudomonadales bacterium]|nr:FecR domain-containing protein [Pseudomonadales bacterium]
MIRFTHPKKAQEAMREQACAWLARLDAGASDEEREQLGQWLNADPAHRDMLFDMAALWDQLAVLSELSDIFPLERYAPRSARPLSRRGLLAVAASLVVALLTVSGGLVLMRGNPAEEAAQLNMVMPRTYETAIGKQQTLDLPDGSRVILNTNTRLMVDYSDALRNIFLEHGEGLFEVSKDASRPFRVHAGNRVVEAVGTAFAVQHLQQDSIAVMVTEGKVNFRSQSADVDTIDPELPAAGSAAAAQANAVLAMDTGMALVAGESAAVSEQNSTIEKKQLPAEEIEVRLAWRYGMLLFQDDTLEQVLQEVSRYTPIRIEADPAIREIRVGGYFRAGDIDGLLVAMRENFQIDAQRIGTDYIRLTAQ